MEFECSDCDSCIDDPIQPYQFEPSGTSQESSDSDEEEELGQGDNERLSQRFPGLIKIFKCIYVFIILLKVFI